MILDSIFKWKSWCDKDDGPSYFYESVNSAERPSRLNENLPSLLHPSRNWKNMNFFVAAGEYFLPPLLPTAVLVGTLL